MYVINSVDNTKLPCNIYLTMPLFNLIVIYSVSLRGYPDERSIRRHHNELNIEPFILYDFQTLVITVRQDFNCFFCTNWLYVSNITNLNCLIEYCVAFKMLKVLYNPSTPKPIAEEVLLIFLYAIIL